jgi:hypothetical protein
MNTVAERVFGQKLLHSEPDRQAYIQQTALRIERDLKAAVRKDKAELHEIAGCVQSFMDAETMGFVRRNSCCRTSFWPRFNAQPNAAPSSMWKR